MRTPDGKQFFFDEFEVDSARRVLLKSGESIALNPKAFDLLVVLVERRGEIVSKNELLDAVWANQFVEEKNLTVHISALRKIFGERKDENRFIATIPGTGYKFVAELTVPPAEEFIFETERIERITVEDKLEIARGGSGEQRRKGTLSKIFVASLAPILLLLLFGGYIWQFRQNLSNNPPTTSSLKRLTSSGHVAAAAISPDSNFYVYSVAKDGQESLWLAQTNGGEPIQLRPPAKGAQYRSVRFSPDGGSLFYVLNDDEHPSGELFKMPVFGGVPEKLRENVGHIAYSPDVSQIAFVRNEPKAAKSALLIGPIDSRDAREIAAQPFAQRFAPYSLAWSPDGSTISIGGQSADGNFWNIYAVTIVSGEINQLTDSVWTSVRGTAWQPDGSAVLVQADERFSSISNWQLYEVNYPSGAVRRVISDLNSYYPSLSYSADGKKLLTIQGQSIGNIWVAPASNLDAARQVTSGSIGELNGWWGIAWTPKGEIIYVKFFDKTRTIWKMDSDGSNQKPLVPPVGDNFYPSVTFDGRFVIFESSRNGKNDVWRANSDGSQVRQLTDVGDARQPNVSPDGKWVVYTAGAENEERLYRIPIDGGETVQLTSNQATWPQISPDGKLVTCLYRTEKGAKLAILPIGGGEPQKLFDIPPRANFRLGVHWFPDGNAVAYRDWGEGIWLQKLDTAAPEQMSDLPNEKLYAFAWSKDGKFFAYTRGNEIRDVVLFSNLK